MSNWYLAGLQSMAKAGINWETADAVKVMLVDDSYSFDAAHDQVSDITGHEVNPTDYVRKSLTTPTVAIASSKVRLRHGTITWTALGGVSNATIGGAVYFIQAGGADSSRIPLFFVDVNDFVTADNDVLITPDATLGVATLGNS